MTDLVRRAQRLQVLTIVWMTAEAMIALASAWTARSPALLGFGGDSAIELLSAIVVLWRFRSRLAAKRQETCRHPHHRLAANQIGGELTSGLSVTRKKLW
jgi:uncharacterized membrane protein